MACLVLLLVSGCWEEDFTCRDEGRLLTDAEFLEIAFNYEVSENDLPEPYLSLGIDGIMEIDPGCCAVMLENNPFNEPRDALSRLLFDPTVLVLIGWDLDPNHGPNNSTDYSMTLCGYIIEPRGDYRPRNDQ